MNELTLQEAMNEYAQTMLKATGIEKPTSFSALVKAYFDMPIDITRRNLGIDEKRMGKAFELKAEE